MKLTKSQFIGLDGFCGYISAILFSFSAMFLAVITFSRFLKNSHKNVGGNFVGYIDPNITAV